MHNFFKIIICIFIFSASLNSSIAIATDPESGSQQFQPSQLSQQSQPSQPSQSSQPQPFTKVYFFGDSLTDVGNNRDNLFDQAPVTNKIETKTGEFHDGPVWAVPFLEFMRADHLLADNASLNVIPSAKISEAKDTDSIDFAYSGDPSGGYDDTFKITTYHLSLFKKLVPNAICSIFKPGNTIPNTVTENDYCGMYNRVHNSAVKHDLDKDALFVLWAGANDIGQSIDLVIAVARDTLKDFDPKGKKILEDAANRLGDQLSAHVVLSMQDLMNKGAHNFLVVNLPKVGYTPVAYSLDNDFALLHKGEHNIIIDMLNNVALHINTKLNTALTQLAKDHPEITIYAPDLNVMFDAMRAGKIAAFPTKVNANPTLAWDTTCCSNQELKMPNYIPSNCKPSWGKAEVCNRGSIALADGSGYYAFFNYIHPSTCAHRYIARLLELSLLKREFDPSEKLCDQASQQ
ncbi:MAG: SGNH/GDSL hydrolase family protein [Gammaproteobacteria bacterium]|nr:SGNH/GDSL hydrolase family protein [Gammaproteobacteria bacterium]